MQERFRQIDSHRPSSNCTSSPVQFLSEFESQPQHGFNLLFRALDVNEFSIAASVGGSDLSEADDSTKPELLGAGFFHPVLSVLA